MRSLRDIHIKQDADWKSYNAYRKKTLKGFQTGIPELDSNVLGLTGIVGIQGSPGSCKSTLAMQIASFNASRGTPVLFIDRENGKHRFKDRLISQLFKIPPKTVKEASDLDAREFYDRLTSLDLYVDTEPCSSSDIRSYLEEMYAEYEKPMLLVVDSLQSLPKTEQDERMSLQKWLEDLDQLKLDYVDKLTIIMTSEKSRGKYKEGTNDGGKGTGSIEYKCELLFDIRLDESSGLLFLDLVKNRDGATFQNHALEKIMASDDPNSFTFTLEDADYQPANSNY
jgi:predicted ATP-dependent serine protease